jgi:hypothetical protein
LIEKLWSQQHGVLAEPEALGRALADELRAQGAEEILAALPGA